MEPEYVESNEISQPCEMNSSDQVPASQPSTIFPGTESSVREGNRTEEQEPISKEEYFRVLDELKAKNSANEFDKETYTYDGDTSCLATCTTSDLEDDPFKGSSYSYEMEGEFQQMMDKVLSPHVLVLAGSGPLNYSMALRATVWRSTYGHWAAFLLNFLHWNPFFQELLTLIK